LLDWKGKHSNKWLMNERAYKAYLDWKNKMNMPVFVVFFLFNEKESLMDSRLAAIGIHKPQQSKEKEWDKNKTVGFDNSLSAFTKSEIIKYLL
jgi:hypothetical protein